jgi:hypothetical protein
MVFHVAYLIFAKHNYPNKKLGVMQKPAAHGKTASPF